MEALLIMGGLYYLILVARRNKQIQDEKNKEDWRVNNCSKEEHFVGKSIYEGTVYCDVCKKVPKKITWKKGQIDGWRWV